MRPCAVIRITGPHFDPARPSVVAYTATLTTYDPDGSERGHLVCDGDSMDGAVRAVLDSCLPLSFTKV